LAVFHTVLIGTFFYVLKESAVKEKHRAVAAEAAAQVPRGLTSSFMNFYYIDIFSKMNRLRVFFLMNCFES
jgi:hypothetical protein